MILRIRIEDEKSMDFYETMCVKLDPEFLRPAMRAIDRPEAGVHPRLEMLCSTKDEIMVTEQNRIQLANYIGRNVEEFMLAFFQKNDTTMGYRNDGRGSE